MNECEYPAPSDDRAVLERFALRAKQLHLGLVTHSFRDIVEARRMADCLPGWMQHHIDLARANGTDTDEAWKAVVERARAGPRLGALTILSESQRFVEIRALAGV